MKQQQLLRMDGFAVSHFIIGEPGRGVTKICTGNAFSNGIAEFLDTLVSAQQRMARRKLIIKSQNIMI